MPYYSCSLPCTCPTLIRCWVALSYTVPSHIFRHLYHDTGASTPLKCFELFFLTVENDMHGRQLATAAILGYSYIPLQSRGLIQAHFHTIYITHTPTFRRQGVKDMHVLSEYKHTHARVGNFCSSKSVHAWCFESTLIANS